MDINRRKFISTTATIIGGIPFTSIGFSKDNFRHVRFGIFTDSHYADREPSGTRFYRESLRKLSECVDLMNEQKVDFMIELGDFKDQGDPPDEKETLHFLAAVEKEFCRFKGPHYHVLGNHDHDSVSKKQFLHGISNTGMIKDTGYYSFDVDQVHFVVLDANYTSDGIPYDHGNFDWTDAHVPGKQLKWLRKDLAGSRKPVVVFIHHRLDITGENRVYGPGNADDVRNILEEAGNVMIVFQGHHHVGALNRINDITYYTLKAMVEGSGPENNSYVIAEIDRDLIIKVKGYRKAVSGEFS